MGKTGTSKTFLAVYMTPGGDLAGGQSGEGQQLFSRCEVERGVSYSGDPAGSSDCVSFGDENSALTGPPG